MTPVRVVIVEDDDEIKQWLKTVVSANPDLNCVAAFQNAELFSASFDALEPEVVIMDIHLPGKSGIECVAQLKPKRPETQYIMCTIFEDADNIFESLRAGATGYLLKNQPAEELQRAILEVYKGGSPMSSSIARKVVDYFQKKNESAALMAQLSARQREILQYLSEGYRYKEIADKLFVSTETVRTHIRNIYEKLQVQSRTEALNKLFPR
jgi:DNA-binding NarL/FixJ family response regulator